mgnify:FL=1
MKAKQKVKTYKFYSDSGHGWLAVKKEDLVMLCIVGDISRYSYTKGDTVYLEEDCDFPKFFRALNAEGLSFNYVSVYHEGRSRIRSYDSYSAEKFIEELAGDSCED